MGRPKRGDPRVLRLVVRFLRDHADLSQTEFGKACRVDQVTISHYETDEAVPEEVLRRMAAVARVEFGLVMQLGRVYAAIPPTAPPGRVGGGGAGRIGDPGAGRAGCDVLPGRGRFGAVAASVAGGG